MEVDARDRLAHYWPAYVLSFVLYVVLGLLIKSTVLNWVIGPLWLLLTLWLVPNGLRWIARRIAA